MMNPAKVNIDKNADLWHQALSSTRYNNIMRYGICYKTVLFVLQIVRVRTGPPPMWHARWVYLTTPACRLSAPASYQAAVLNRVTQHMALTLVYIG